MRFQHGFDKIRALQSQGKLVARTRVVGAGEERSVGSEHSGGDEAEVAVAVRSVVGKKFHDVGGGFYRGPVEAVVLGDDEAGLELVGLGENVRELLRFRSYFRRGQ